MSKESLEFERDTLIAAIADMEYKINEEQNYFLQSGSRTARARDWRLYAINRLNGFKVQLADVLRYIREEEAPEKRVKHLIKDMSLLKVLKLWWMA